MKTQDMQTSIRKFPTISWDTAFKLGVYVIGLIVLFTTLQNTVGNHTDALKELNRKLDKISDKQDKTSEDVISIKIEQASVKTKLQDYDAAKNNHTRDGE